MSLLKNEQQSQNLLLKVDPRSTFRNNFLQPATFFFLLRDKLITGENRETSMKTCNETKEKKKRKPVGARREQEREQDRGNSTIMLRKTI